MLNGSDDITITLELNSEKNENGNYVLGRTTEIVNVGAGKGGVVSVSKTYNNTEDTVVSKVINGIIDYLK